MLGRGLRLSFGQRTGRQMLDTVEVLSHRRFRDLLNDAGTLLEAFFTALHPAHLVAPDSAETLDGDAAVAAGADSGRLDVFVRPTDGVDASGEPVEGGLFGAAVEDVERRIAEAEHQALVLSTTMDLVAGASRVRFPRLTPRLVPQPFSLSSVPNQAAVDLGGHFATDTVPTLDRQALLAARVDDDRGQGVRVEASVAEDPVEASQLALALETLRDRIRRDVLRSRFVTSTRQESNAINRLVGKFLDGAGVTDDDSGSWTEAKVRAAVDSFLALVRTYHSQRGTSLQNEVELVDYPPREIVSPDEVWSSRSTRSGPPAAGIADGRSRCCRRSGSTPRAPSSPSPNCSSRARRRWRGGCGWSPNRMCGSPGGTASATTPTSSP